MDKIKLEQEWIKSNLQYEEDLTQILQSEIETLDEYLEFIFENKINELVIRRSTININREEDYCPSQYYNAGHESGTYLNKEGYLLDECEKKDGKMDIKSYKWIEWNIYYENISYKDNFNIIITPFVININSFSYLNHKNDPIERDGYRQERINIFTNKFWDKWNSKLQEHVISKKRDKITSMINDSYKILGIEREAKLKSILG